MESLSGLKTPNQNTAMKRPSLKILFAAFALMSSSAALAEDSPCEAAVREASSNFVTAFNEQDTKSLGKFYRFDGVLKLPDQPAVSGRESIRSAWQGGFDNGLGSLKLEITNLDDLGFNKVLESGTYKLAINTPDGPLLQTGTYSVMWVCRYTWRGKLRTKILFDTIDAIETK